MTSVSEHLNGGGDLFSAESLAIMEDAYQRACRALTAPLSVHEVLIRRIVELIRKGERNPRSLCHEGLAALNMVGDCE